MESQNNRMADRLKTVYPLNYIRFAGGGAYDIFLISTQNIDSVYPSEPFKRELLCFVLEQKSVQIMYTHVNSRLKVKGKLNNKELVREGGLNYF